MPGHMMMLTCECGIKSTVEPGVFLDESGFVPMVIVYDAENMGFITMRSDEAESLGLRRFENPYISDPSKFTFEIEEEVSSRGYQCPNCGEMKLQYLFIGHWD